MRNWGDLDDAAHFLTNRPLPKSNSDIAKELRVVKVLAIIADTIDKHLLQPTYQISNGKWPLSSILYSLARTDARRERVVRGMLLAVLAGERENAKAELSRRIAEDVMRERGVEQIISREDHLDFVNTLEGLLSSVHELWSDVQYSTKVFESSFEDFQGKEFDWAVANVAESESTQSPMQGDEEDVVLLFPKILLVGNEDKCIAPGTIVRKSQISALFKEERRNVRSAEDGPSRARQRPGRTLSMSSSIRNGPTKEPFLSEKAESSKQSNA
ncbi:hypothetical protein SLS59_004782 [Nothophoma quercina]|uniref:Uncharacterized protein n=1 Tax=Nothophoma quercina TaxID=749835 RepID=A0ABR3RF95_9PLEO